MSIAITSGVTFGPVSAEPYLWPYDGGFRPESTALINIDWQVDFCGIGGYVDRMGYDLNLTRAGLEPTARVLPWGTQVAARLPMWRESTV